MDIMSGNSPHNVSATFTFKDVESKEKFIEFCNGEKGLSVTRAWKGCQSWIVMNHMMIQIRLN